MKGSMKKQPKNIKEFAAWLGSHTSEKKKKSSRKNFEKAREVLAGIRKKEKENKPLDNN